MTILQTILAAVNWDTRVNENFASVSPAAMYAFDPTSSNLNLKIKGGFFGTTAIADYSTTLTASSNNNYVVYSRATGAISHSTGTTNWNDDANYGRIGIANAATVTFSWSDRRTGPFVPPGAGTVASVNGQSGIVTIGVGDLDDVDLTGLANGDTLVWDSGTSTWVPGTGGGGGGQASIQFQDEGSNLGGSGSADTVNFAGAGVAAARVGNTVTVTIAGGGGSGDVVGPGSSTDNTLARFDGTTGKAIQGSGVNLSDNNEIDGYLANINSQSGTTYTLQATDSGKIIECSNASAITVTVPNSLPKGFNCTIIQGGAGQVTISAGSGATARIPLGSKTPAQYRGPALYVRANSGGSSAEYVITGDSTA